MGRAYKTLPLYPRYLSLSGTKVLWILWDRYLQIMYKNLWLSEVKIFPKLQLPLKLKRPTSPVSENEGREGSGTREPMQSLTECFLPSSWLPALSGALHTPLMLLRTSLHCGFWWGTLMPMSIAVLQVVAQSPEA